MTLAVYTGHEALTFPDYLDQETGRTLTAEPGRTYDITPASGRPVPDIPAGWFTSVVTASGGITLSPPGLTGEVETAEPAAGDGEPEDVTE